MAHTTQLIEGARTQASEAWHELYLLHAPAVRRVCQGFSSLSPADVEDLVQESFVRAYNNIEQLRDDARFRPWLLTIARSRALNRLRSRAASRRAADAYAADPAKGASAPRVDPNAQERQQRIAIVRELIAGLPDGPEAETVRLFYIEGELSARQIAEKLGVGKSTITMRLERFRAKVKARLAARLLRAGVDLP